MMMLIVDTILNRDKEVIGDQRDAKINRTLVNVEDNELIHNL